jgi:hypothetical protein
MNIMLRHINWTKKSGILIIGICLSAILLKYLVQPYRGTWSYKYGNMISLFLFYGGVLCSLINTFLLIAKHKTNLKNNLIWILFSAIPFLYTITMIVL